MSASKTVLGAMWLRQHEPTSGTDGIDTFVRNESSQPSPSSPRPAPASPPPAEPRETVTKVRGEASFTAQVTEVRGETSDPEPPPPEPDYETRTRGESAD
jgi:hypothetical protein